MIYLSIKIQVTIHEVIIFYVKVISNPRSYVFFLSIKSLQFVEVRLNQIFLDYVDNDGESISCQTDKVVQWLIIHVNYFEYL